MAWAILCLGYATGAQTINNVYWDFSNPSGADQPTSGAISGLTTSLSFGNAASLSYNNTSPSGGYTTHAGFAASGDNNAYVAARPGAFDLTTNTYFSFNLSLAASAGTAYSITDISLGSRSTSTGPSSLALYFSQDNSSFSAVGSAQAVNQDSGWAAVDFSGAAIALPNDGSTVYFRLYGSGGSSTSSGNWRIDDLAVTLTSVAAVPEPATLTLAIIGGMACFFALRRKS
jgi:hypothetical protein